jgi:hypothetical protein
MYIRSTHLYPGKVRRRRPEAECRIEREFWLLLRCIVIVVTPVLVLVAPVAGGVTGCHAMRSARNWKAGSYFGFGLQMHLHYVSLSFMAWRRSASS